MKIEQASRKRAKIKMALQGPSGSGKTMSALLLAFGLCGDWTKICVVDTENHSAELYSHLGFYNVVSDLQAPFTPEKYRDAIKLCEQNGIEVIILDSCSHEWECILEMHAGMAGNSFTNWGRLTPRHNEFVQAILQSSCHVIGTIRSKQDYILQEKNGKMVPEKVGLKGVTRDGMDFEFTIVLDIDMKHNANCSKDRTQLFSNKPEFRIGIETGKQILAWCNSGAPPLDSTTPASISLDILLEQIKQADSIEGLIELFKQQPKELQEKYHTNFVARRHELTPQQLSKTTISEITKPQANGKPNPAGSSN